MTEPKMVPSNCYGRGVAFYNTVDSRVVDCEVTNVLDEAIDFDHFTERCVAARNRIRGALWGVVGMLLATPITAVMKMLFERLELTAPLARILAGNLGETRAG